MDGGALLQSSGLAMNGIREKSHVPNQDTILQNENGGAIFIRKETLS
jgi:hypothetical protein